MTLMLMTCSCSFTQKNIHVTKSKVFAYSIMSIGLGADPGFLAVSLQVTLVINPVIGCRYFPPAKEIMPLVWYQLTLLGDRGTQV